LICESQNRVELLHGTEQAEIENSCSEAHHSSVSLRYELVRWLSFQSYCGHEEEGD
jgi:hypothetical protein